MSSPTQKFTCLGPSEWPVIRSGQNIYVQAVDAEKISPGDLVVYECGELKICHRVIAKSKKAQTYSFLLKADAKPFADGWIDYDRIRGKVFYVNGHSVESVFFNLISLPIYMYSKAQHRLFLVLFQSRIGLLLGRARRKFIAYPIFMNAFVFLTTPLAWRRGQWQVFLGKADSSGLNVRNIWNLFRARVGQSVFNRWIHPPSTCGIRMRPHGADYGHGYLYEEIFCRGETDVADIVRLVAGNTTPILDLAGGGGRLAVEMVRAGADVTLVDMSQSMLDIARQRQKNVFGQFEIVCQDVRQLNLGRRYGVVVSLRNALEHLGSELEIDSTLRGVWNHLQNGGIFYVDVHNEPFWEKKRGWRKNLWVYEADMRILNRRTRLWEKTFTGKTTNHLIWQHAISYNCINYTLLSTELMILPVDAWVGLFTNTGFRVLEIWGNWRGELSGPNYPKTIFKLEKRV